MRVVIEEEGKFIPMGVGVMILFTMLIRKEIGGYEITINNASNGPQVINIVPLGL
jgi:hypothetical protein